MSESKPLEGLHAIGYCRVSTDDHGQDTGIQEQAIKDWAQSQGVTIDAIMSEDMSGAIFPRPQLSMALMTLATTQASILICYDQSRLTRDADHHIPLIKKLIGDKVIRYVVNGSQDPESVGIRVINAIKGVTDSEERKVLKAKTSLALQYKRDVLHIHVGRPSKIVITDHPEEYNVGKVAQGPREQKKTTTRVITPDQLLGWARQGWTPSYVATTLLEVSPQLFHKVLDESGYKEQYYIVLKKAKTGA